MIERSHIVGILKGHFSSPVSTITQIDRGAMTFKYQFNVDDVPYILRVYPRTRSYVAQKEFDILKKLYNLGSRVPVVVAVGNNHGISYLIYRMLMGNALTDSFDDLSSDEKEALYQQIFSNISSFSNHSFLKFGAFVEDESLYNNWQEFLEVNIAIGNNYLSNHNLLTKAERESLLRFMTRKSGLVESGHPVLVWSDFSTTNIITDGARLAGFIDFEGSIAGHPLLSLGYLYAQEGESEFCLGVWRQFKKMYEFDYSHIAFYAIMRLYRIVKYYDQPLPTGLPRQKIFDHFKGLQKCINYIRSNCP